VRYRRKKLTFAISSPDEFLLNFGIHYIFGTDKQYRFRWPEWPSSF